MEKENNQPYVVLYSCSQGHFHIEPAAITGSKTLQNIQRGVRQDYVLLAICRTQEEAFDKGLEIRKIREESPLWPEAEPIPEAE